MITDKSIIESIDKVTVDVTLTGGSKAALEFTDIKAPIMETVRNTKANTDAMGLMIGRELTDHYKNIVIGDCILKVIEK